MNVAPASGPVAALERLVFSLRWPLLAVFVAITVYMVFLASQLRVDAGFKKQLPLQHEYMQTFLDYEEEFGGANRLLVAVMAEDGDMFDAEFFRVLEEVTNAVFFIPGVNRASVRSIFTPNVRFVEIVEDGFAGGNVIPADFSPTPEMLTRVRGNIIKAGVVGRLVAEDFSGAMVWADLMEENPNTGEKLDYQAVAAQLEDIRQKFESQADSNVSVHVIGFAKIVGDIADGARSVIWFFGLAIAITAVLLFLYSGSVKLTLLPLICSLVAVAWQLGSLRLLGYGIDPMNMLTPFLVFAIGVSHGVQMINAWSAEVAAGDGEVSPLTAARSTFRRLLIPGAIALLSDTIGFLTILLIDIRIIQELATTASIGVALIILTNMVLMPILLSFTRLRNIERFRRHQERTAARLAGIWHAICGFTKPVVAMAAIVIGAVLWVVGYILGEQLQIGDLQSGVPELRPESRYNQDAEVIASRFSLGVDSISIITEATPNACTEDYAAMELIDRFAWHLRNVDGVQQVITLPAVAKTINAGWNEGNIRWQVLPRNNYTMRQNLQNVDTDTGLLNADCSAMPVIAFTSDHKAETITRVVNAVKSFRSSHGAGGTEDGTHQPAPKENLEPGQVNFRLATGNVGVMAATNEVVAAAQRPMLLWVYAAIVALCLITFRSLRATICIVAPLTLVSVLAYALMSYLGIGLKVNTLPVVALGVGIGVDYGIYIYARLAAHLEAGLSLSDAYFLTLRETGKPVIFTAITLAVGVGTWYFSALQFQADMGILLAFMFFLNMVGAIVLLPALARWLGLEPSHDATAVSDA